MSRKRIVSHNFNLYRERPHIDIIGSPIKVVA